MAQRVARRAAVEALDPRRVVSWLSGLVAVAGLWLIISPWLLAYGFLLVLTWNDVIGGAALALLGFLGAYRSSGLGWLYWLIAIIGAWVFAAGFLFDSPGIRAVLSIITNEELGRAQVAFWNNLIIGTLAFVLGTISGIVTVLTEGWV